MARDCAAVWTHWKKGGKEEGKEGGIVRSRSRRAPPPPPFFPPPDVFRAPPNFVCICSGAKIREEGTQPKIPGPAPGTEVIDCVVTAAPGTAVSPRPAGRLSAVTVTESYASVRGSAGGCTRPGVGGKGPCGDRKLRDRRSSVSGWLPSHIAAPGHRPIQWGPRGVPNQVAMFAFWSANGMAIFSFFAITSSSAVGKKLFPFCIIN